VGQDRQGLALGSACRLGTPSLQCQKRVALNVSQLLAISGDKQPAARGLDQPDLGPWTELDDHGGGFAD
jgi:hypothetical protein